MLAACVIGSLIFARQITKPIQTLADTANRMANLEDVPPLPARGDELGLLARDIHFMYDKLKETISRLEDEILRERELEETQRYFFSAASHELKTPIAAMSVLLEGMLENVGDYKNHPKYLRECMRMMDVQGKIISEILEIVSLNNGRIISSPEKLDLGAAVAGLLPEFQTLSMANGSRIIADIPDGQVCLADLHMLQKALSNIILNAVQNTPRKPVRFGYGARRLQTDTAFVCRIREQKSTTQFCRSCLTRSTGWIRRGSGRAGKAAWTDDCAKNTGSHECRVWFGKHLPRRCVLDGPARSISSNGIEML
jgi:signal transduction histidine kinase